ncbi:hypothetical protein C1646_675147 [Rhizophagus diaphanus]|nr:hypothetical protein C1646_675147 [Rhizophagus diaphanus] [Rhizophagus sp. MUCL 43196]
MENSARRTNSALMSSRLMNNNKGKPVCAKDLPIIMPGISNESEHPETDEVVDNINKFRKNLLDEDLPPRKSLPIKEYTMPEEVSNVMKEWRNFEFMCGKPLKTLEEIKKAKERENKDWKEWLSHFEKKSKPCWKKKKWLTKKKKRPFYPKPRTGIPVIEKRKKIFR